VVGYFSFLTIEACFPKGATESCSGLESDQSTSSAGACKALIGQAVSALHAPIMFPAEQECRKVSSEDFSFALRCMHNTKRSREERDRGVNMKLPKVVGAGQWQRRARVLGCRKRLVQALGPFSGAAMTSPEPANLFLTSPRIRRGEQMGKR
jgi:hypothetical protein